MEQDEYLFQEKVNNNMIDDNYLKINNLSKLSQYNSINYNIDNMFNKFNFNINVTNALNS